MQITDLVVKRIKSGDAKTYIRAHHYSKSCHNGPSPCYGLFAFEEMIGCLVFATPCSENVRRWALGHDQVNATIELHRLYIIDETPKCTETWFISKCLKALKRDRPQTKIVVSFSDTTEGHRGTIYQASNFVQTGMTGRARFYRDAAGALRHPRQNGCNISANDADKLGWTAEWRESKIRYHYPLGANTKEKRALRKLLETKAKGELE